MQMRDERARPVLRVVVAEDERPARALLVSALRMQHDIEIVAEAHDGISLRDALVAGDADAVFMDEGLPNRASVTAHLESLRPVLVLTSTDAMLPEPSARNTTARVSLPLLLPKPFTGAELDAVLRDVRRTTSEFSTLHHPLDERNESVAAKTSATSPASPMWGGASGAHEAQADSRRGAVRVTPESTSARRRWGLGRGVIGFVLLWIVLYLLVLAPPGATSRNAIITGKAVDDALQSHVRLSFSSLSGFDYHPGMSKSELPAEVRRAEGREVAIYGYMLPVDVNGKGVSRFLLNASYDMCMFGMAAGGPHQWVAVEMADGRRAPFTHMPIVVFGTLDIGEQRQNGRVTSMYRLRADKVALYDR